MTKVLCPVNVADRTQNSAPVPVLSDRPHNCKHPTLHIIKNYRDAQNGYFILCFNFPPKFIFILCIWVTYLHVYLYNMCKQISLEARRGCRSLGTVLTCPIAARIEP